MIAFVASSLWCVAFHMFQLDFITRHDGGIYFWFMFRFMSSM